MKTKITFLSFLFAVIFSATAQDKKQGATYIGSPESMIYVSSLASRANELTPAITEKIEAEDGRSSIRRPKRDIVPGKGNQVDILSQKPHLLQGKVPGRAPDLVFDAAISSTRPTDPSLAVGPNHVFVVFNTGFAIYDKEGGTLVGQVAPNPAIFPAEGCCDLTVSYDPLAVSAANPIPGRWIVSYLGVGTGVQIAVSDGPDPVNDGWNIYVIPQVNDYNKVSVWSNGYYLTDQAAGNRLYALERQAMIDGEPAANVSIQGFMLPNIGTFGFASPQVLNISDDNYPDSGNATVVFFQDDAYAGINTDHIKFWDVDVDFETPTNSVVSLPQEIDVTPFNSIFDGGASLNLLQPNDGGALDALQGILMNQAQYRKFPTHNSAIFNFTIDAGTDGNKLAATRWYEFRQTDDGQPWAMFQEGTYTSPDGKHAWNASMTMDNQGNIAMGYTGMGNMATGAAVNQVVSSYYTGRASFDPLGVMTIAEQVIAIGGDDIDGFGDGRYGDYSKIDIDPTDYQTMWYINEYMSPVNGRADVIGRFKIASENENDIAVIAINTPETGNLQGLQDVTVTVRNFGSLDASGFDVTYQIDGGTLITQLFDGVIESESNMEFTFTTQADLSIVGQTYIITACTDYDIDEENANDCTSSDVTHLNSNDLGVTNFISPSGNVGFSDTETVTIVITNFGSVTQTSIPVFYTLDGGAPVLETYTGSIAQGATDTYTFTTATVDLSELGDYEFVAGTEFVGDTDTSNDDITLIISNTICQPGADCSSLGDGITQIELVDQDIITNCGTSPIGYSDDTDIVFNFVLSENPFAGNIQVGFDNSNYAIFIDFNDDGDFEPDELVLSGIGGDSNTDSPIIIDFSDITTVTPGTHRMRIRGADQSGPNPGDVINPCENLEFGRTNDYTANITGILGAQDTAFANAELLIRYLPGDQYEVTFNTTAYKDRLPITIYNISGQKLAFYTLENNGSGYSKTIDMSYVANGVYFVKVGNDELNKVKRIIVR